MRMITLISIISFIFSSEYGSNTFSKSDEFNYQSNSKIAFVNEDPNQSENTKSNKVLFDRFFNITTKLENIFYLGVGIGSILWIFLDGEAEFYHNKYTEYNDMYEFNNSYNGYLNKYESYHNGAQISKYVTLTSTMLLILNKFYKGKQSTKQINGNKAK